MSLNATQGAKEQAPVAALGVEASIIVPFWNEAGNLVPLTEALRAALNEQGRTWEVLLVNDGSTDDSVGEAEGISAVDARFRVVSLQQHLGKSAALAAGRDLARGSAIVTIDADLQDPPDMVPAFLDKLDEGFDVVAAVRCRRREPVHRRVASAAFNGATKWMTGVPLRDMNAGLKAYRRPAFGAVRLSRGMHRFIPVLAHGQGYSVAEVPVQHGERFAGRTKYGWWRYVETVVCFGAVMVLRRGPEAAMRMLIRLGGLLGVVGAGVLVAGWAWESLPLLIVGAIACLLASQFVVGRLVAEIVFQLNSSARPARPPYELERPTPGRPVSSP